jgi:hypothetical protein
MDPIRSRTWALDALAAACLFAVAGPIAWHAIASIRP